MEKINLLKSVLQEYFYNEFDEEIELDLNSNIDIAYTEYEDFSIQVDLDTVKLVIVKTLTYSNGEVKKVYTHFKTIDEIIDFVRNMSFDELVSIE